MGRKELTNNEISQGSDVPVPRPSSSRPLLEEREEVREQPEEITVRPALEISDTELKATAYDLMATISELQKKFNEVNQILAQRATLQR